MALGQWLDRGLIPLEDDATIGLRSILFAPGNHARKLDKVFTLGADAVILDLEDAVPPAEKAAARNAVVTAMQLPRECRGYIRVNAPGTGYCREDLAAIVGAAPVDGVVLPKAESAADIATVDGWIASHEQSRGLRAGAIELMAIIESAVGVENALEIAAASPRLGRLALGGADYTVDLGYDWTPDEEVLAYARARLTHATRIAALAPAIDTVVLQVRDEQRFRDSAERGRRFGFGGKLCIHPSQVAICHEVFTPSAADIEQARAVVAAFEQAEAGGSAAMTVGDQFVDYAVLKRAQQLLALARRVQR
ncbi:MAG: CoA ester lyase [Gammaproteobacteria bacterium]|nr:CoA ester lyase [Gammaproteobacteria bacterium]